MTAFESWSLTGSGLSLLVSVATLIYLIKYVHATNTIAAQSIRQAEATFRPALVCVPGRNMDNGPELVNIGKGPALEIEWTYRTTTEPLKDRIAYLEPEQTCSLRYFPSVKPLFEPAMEPPTIFVNYKSISGTAYSSACTYDPDRNEFRTKFSGLEQ
jgi:hypothetical protein